MRAIFASGCDISGAGIERFADGEPGERLFSPGGEIVPDMEYIDDIAAKLKEHGKEVDALIEETSENRSLSRMRRSDLSVLRLAVTEMLYVDEISDAVAISEAVTLAGKYGEENSKAFVNGILGKISQKKGER
jgi:N utilization substance protein B